MKRDINTYVLAGDVGALLSLAKHAKGIAAQRHARDLLERALLRADPGAVTTQQREAARRFHVDSLVCDAPEITVPPHAVLVPVVLMPALPMQRAVGIVRYMRVAFDASTHGGYGLAFDPVAARSVSDALQLAANHLDQKALDRAYCLTTVHPDAFSDSTMRVQLTGPSLGAAAFVSALSLWSGRRVRQGTVVTGKLLGSHVREVGDIDAKLRAAVRTRADVVRVIVPMASREHARRALRGVGATSGTHDRRIEVTGVSSVDELADAALEPQRQQTEPIRHRLAMLRLEFDQGWLGYGWANIREHAERLVSVVPERSVDLRVDLLAMLGATHERLGSPPRALEVLQQAAQLAESEAGKRSVSDLLLSQLHQRIAMTQRRLCRFREARRAAARAIMFARRGRHPDEIYKAHGCAGLVELAAGRALPAVRALERSLALVHEHAPDSCVRSHAYLIEAYARAGDSGQAETAWIEAIDHAQRAPTMLRGSTSEAWLRTSRGTALWILGRTADAVATLDVPTVRATIETAALPGMWARRYLGLSLIAEGRVIEGQTLLAASEVAYGPTLGANLMFGARLNVLCEASALLSRDHWDSDIAGRARSALLHFPEQLQVGTMERLRRRALSGIAAHTRPNAATGEALRNLIALTTRIA